MCVCVCVYVCVHGCLHVCVCVSVDLCTCSVTWSCLSFCDPMDCNIPGSSVHGIFQGGILEWVAISSSRGSFPPRDWTHLFPILHWPAESSPLHHLESPIYLSISIYLLYSFTSCFVAFLFNFSSLAFFLIYHCFKFTWFTFPHQKTIYVPICMCVCVCVCVCIQREREERQRENLCSSTVEIVFLIITIRRIFFLELRTCWFMMICLFIQWQVWLPTHIPFLALVHSMKVRIELESSTAVKRSIKNYLIPLKLEIQIILLFYIWIMLWLIYLYLKLAHMSCYKLGECLKLDVHLKVSVQFRRSWHIYV